MPKYKCNDCNHMFEGSEFSNTDWHVTHTVDNPDPFSSPSDYGATDQKSVFPNTNYLPATDGNPDQQPWSNVAASKDTGHGQCARSEATWRVKLFDGRGVQYFPDEQLANKYYAVALKEDKDPSKPEPYIYKKASIEHIEINGEEVPVLINPTADELIGLAERSAHKSVRGLIDPNTGDLYAWEAYEAIHTDIIQDLGLNIDYYQISGITSHYVLHFSGQSVLRMLDYQKEVRDKLKQNISASKKEIILTNKLVTDMIPVFVDKTEPEDHKCRTCSFKIEKDGKATCGIMEGEINLEKGTCNYWSQREIKDNATTSKMSRKTAGYIEVNGIINCSTCIHYEHDFCNLWKGKVKDEQCCMAWEGKQDKKAFCKKESSLFFSIGDRIVDKFSNKGTVVVQRGTKIPGETEVIVRMDSGEKLKYKPINLSKIDTKQAFSKKELNKQANPPTRFWIAPDGKEFSTGSAGHGAWIKLNKDILKQYRINISTVGYTWPDMINKGWTRVSNEPSGTGFTIEVSDLTHIPAYIDNFIAKYFSEGDSIQIGSKDNFVRIENPFPSIQKAVNKVLRNPINANLKQADLSGQTINEILRGIQTNGGITYNLQQGNLANSDLYAVSIFSDREQIVEGVDFDTIEGYIETNQDLLNDSNNSLGVWTNKGKVYMDVVQTISDKEKALELAKQYGQLAIFNLRTMEEITTGVQRNIAFSKKELIKQAEKSLLTEDQQNQIASKWGPVMNLALNNYAQAVKNGHDPIRALKYAEESVINIGGVKESDLKGAINIYLKGLV